MSRLILRVSIIAAVIGNCAVSVANAFGNDESWVSGWGMGTKEAIITRGPGNEIYVACEEGSSIPSSIRFMLAGYGPKGNSVALTFDGSDPEDFWIVDGQITSDCHACSANFDRVIGLLKSHSSVHVRFDNALSAKFNLNGSSEAIGECVAGFYR